MRSSASSAIARGEELDAEPTTVTTAGRILGIRAFGKANFLVLSDGLAHHPGLRARRRAVGT